MGRLSSILICERGHWTLIFFLQRDATKLMTDEGDDVEDADYDEDADYSYEEDEDEDDEEEDYEGKKPFYHFPMKMSTSFAPSYSTGE